MSLQLSVCWVLTFLLISSCCGASLRFRRTSGKTQIGKLVKPPLTLKHGEASIPAPGWTHCIRPITATSRWRFIRSDQFTVLQNTQFQCTWIIQSSQYQSFVAKHQKQIQISVQTLAMGNRNDARCIRQFIEVIDNGKSQGRFCDSQKPGDYVTIGGSVRIDIQGVDILASLIHLKKEAFVIGYRTVTNVDPGFRAYATRVKSETNPRSNGNGHSKTPETINDGEGDDRIGNLTLGGFIGVIVCCVLVSLLIILIVIKKCCCKKEKTDKDNPHHKDDEESNVYPPPYHKAVSLPLSPNSKTTENFPPAPQIKIKEEVEVKKKNEKFMTPENLFQSSSAKHRPQKESKAGPTKNEKRGKKHKKHQPQQSAKSNKTNNKVKKARNQESDKAKTEKQGPERIKSDSTGKKMKRKLTADEKRQKKEQEDFTVWQEDYPARRAKRSKSRNRKKRKNNLPNENSGENKQKRKKRPESNGADKNGQKTKSKSSKTKTRSPKNT